MNEAERERAYREAMAARRAGERCPACGEHHSALSSCLIPDAPRQGNAEPVRLTPTAEPTLRPGHIGNPIGAAKAGVPPTARRTDPETSHAAAATDKRALRFTCLGFYATVWPEGTERDGMVDDDLAGMAGISEGHESYRRRGSELRALGWTEWWMAPSDTFPTGVLAPVRRKTNLGASARVACITPLGRQVLAAYQQEASGA